MSIMNNKTEEKNTQRLDIQDIPTITSRLPGILERLGTVFIGSLIPLTAVFEALGYSSLVGLYWGLATGAIAAVCGELGYEVIHIGRTLVLRKTEEEDTNSQKVSSDKTPKK